MSTNSGQPHTDGIPLGQLVVEAVADLSGASHDRPQSWDDFLQGSAPADDVWSDDPMAEIARADQVVRSDRNTGMSGPDEARKALWLLAVLHNRVRMSDVGVAEEPRAFKLTSFRSLAMELTFLDEHADDGFEAVAHSAREACLLVKGSGFFDRQGVCLVIAVRGRPWLFVHNGRLAFAAVRGRPLSPWTAGERHPPSSRLDGCWRR